MSTAEPLKWMKKPRGTCLPVGRRKGDANATLGLASGTWSSLGTSKSLDKGGKGSKRRAPGIEREGSKGREMAAEAVNRSLPRTTQPFQMYTLTFLVLDEGVRRHPSRC